MFLQFAPTGAKKIAYAPSFGRDVVDKKIFPQLAQYLSTFSAISIRENTGVAIIKEITGKNVPQLLDPVFLTGKEYWYSLLKAPNFKKPYIAYYSLEMTNTMEKAVHHLAKKLNLPVVILGKAGLLPLKCKTIIAIDAGPQEALGWFQNAAMICTNSFHAVAFSLIFEKPFVVVPHSSRNTRISSLLELADLTSRILPDHAQLSEITAEQLLTIDFTNWKSTLAVELEKSLAYLKNNLRQ
jgi:polysaccharide pyruvyl transferase WcaK-like protein